LKRSSKSILLIALLFIIVVMVLSGCGAGNSTSSNQMPTDSVTKNWSDKPGQTTPPAEQSQNQQSAGQPSTQPPISQTPAPQPAPSTSTGAQPLGAHPTISQVMTSVATSHYLDKTHLDKGLTCDNCHGKVTAGQPVIPPNAQKCLSCHGGSYEANAAKTASIGQYNPMHRLMKI